MGRCQGPMHDVIKGCVPVMSTHAPSTAQTMCDLAIHRSSTMGKRMRPTKGSTKAETHGHPNSIVIHAEAKGGDRQCVQPHCSLLSRSSQKMSSRPRIGGGAALSNRLSTTPDAFNGSQAFWSSCAVPSSEESPCPRDHCVLASSKWEIEEFRRRGGMRSAEAAAEARKAEGASCTAYHKPSPPNFTGSQA